MENEWTFDQPTKEGYYWIEEGVNKFEIAKIRRSIFDKEKLTVTFFESSDRMELTHVKGLQWYGPITPPQIGTMKEKINEKSDS